MTTATQAVENCVGINHVCSVVGCPCACHFQAMLHGVDDRLKALEGLKKESDVKKLNIQVK